MRGGAQGPGRKSNPWIAQGGAIQEGAPAAKSATAERRTTEPSVAIAPAAVTNVAGFPAREPATTRAAGVNAGGLERKLITGGSAVDGGKTRAVGTQLAVQPLGSRGAERGLP